MKLILLNNDAKTKFQSFYENITVEGKSVRARFELRWREATNKWYLSIYNSQTGEAYCLHVPVVTSDVEQNDLLSPFYYKDIGSILNVPVVMNPTSENPQKDNFVQFNLVWGGADAK